MRDAITIDIETNEFEDDVQDSQTSRSLVPSRPPRRSIVPSRIDPASTEYKLLPSSLIPSRPNRTLISSPSVPKPLTKWLSKDTRSNWFRPCVRNRKYAIYSDSFGMKAVRCLNNFPDGATVVSFSGCCLLEYIFLISQGSLLSQGSAHDRSKFVLHGAGRSFYGKLQASKFKINSFCDECKSDCYSQFTGTICIQVSLNTAIKANRPSYQGQNVSLLVQNAYEVSAKVAPKATIVFALPQEPVSYLYLNCEKQTAAFSRLIKSLKQYPNIGFGPREAKNQKWHGKDRLHLDDEGSQAYWAKIKTDLQK